jgi:hypothetical protein
MLLVNGNVRLPEDELYLKADNNVSTLELAQHGYQSANLDQSLQPRVTQHSLQAFTYPFWPTTVQKGQLHSGVRHF